MKEGKREMNKKTLFAFLILYLSLVSCSLSQVEQEAVAHHNRGIEYLYNGDLEQAISEFDQAIEIDPQHAKAYKIRGFAYFDKGEHDKAIAD